MMRRPVILLLCALLLSGCAGDRMRDAFEEGDELRLMVGGHVVFSY